LSGENLDQEGRDRSGDFYEMIAKVAKVESQNKTLINRRNEY
jgi:hypothetical protein